MSTKKINKKRLQGFTLIELLIVVALLGAMAAIMLPSLSANRTKAMEATCDYNQAATIKTLNDHVMLMGTLPDALHTGYQADSLTDGANPTSGTEMAGLPSFTATNMTSNCSGHDLTAEEADSLIAAGIESLTYGSGAGQGAITVATGETVPVLDGWQDDAGAAVTFDTKNETTIEGATVGGYAGVIIPLYISPATDWTKESDGGWGSEVDAKVGVKKVGICKVPADSDFAYYIAYIKAFSSYDAEGEAVPAILIGTSCPECGITNP